MTSIQKLSLRGIRSYSDTEAQTIEFFKPLTIIVGANGSGNDKTTGGVLLVEFS
jgi:DNA repair protein RAD50